MKNKKITTVIIAIILAAIVGTWMWEKRRDQQVPDSQLVWYEIPELGIKFKVTRKVRDDLIYKYAKYQKNNNSKVVVEEGGGVDFSLKSIADKGEFCTVETAPLGGIIKIIGRYDKDDSSHSCSGGIFLKQIDNFFTCYYGPQADNGCFGDLIKTQGLNIRDYIGLDSIEKL